MTPEPPMVSEYITNDFICTFDVVSHSILSTVCETFSKHVVLTVVSLGPVLYCWCQKYVLMHDIAIPQTKYYAINMLNDKIVQ